jgi:hypothetical protein
MKEMGALIGLAALAAVPAAAQGSPPAERAPVAVPVPAPLNCSRSARPTCG